MLCECLTLANLKVTKSQWITLAQMADGYVNKFDHRVVTLPIKYLVNDDARPLADGGKHKSICIGLQQPIAHQFATSWTWTACRTCEHYLAKHR